MRSWIGINCVLGYEMNTGESGDIMSYTKGPWFAGWGKGITGPNASRMMNWEGKYPIRVKGIYGDCHVVAAVPDKDPDHESNAKLIAAAPELLEACEYMLEITGGSDNWKGKTHTALACMETIVAKAKGESA